MKYKTEHLYQLENLSKEDIQTAAIYDIPNINWCYDKGLIKISEKTKEWSWYGLKTDGKWYRWGSPFILEEN